MPRPSPSKLVSVMLHPDTLAMLAVIADTERDSANNNAEFHARKGNAQAAEARRNAANAWAISASNPQHRSQRGTVSSIARIIQTWTDGDGYRYVMADDGRTWYWHPGRGWQPEIVKPVVTESAADVATRLQKLHAEQHPELYPRGIES